MPPPERESGAEWLLQRSHGEFFLKLQAVLCDLMVFFRDWSLEEVRQDE
jgi:hypothetical protein